MSWVLLDLETYQTIINTEPKTIEMRSIYRKIENFIS